jgi:hypothetical protein
MVSLLLLNTGKLHYLLLLLSLLIFIYLNSKWVFIWWQWYYNKKETPWPKSASELYRPSDRRLLAKLVQTFGDRVCHVVSATDP